MKKITLEDIEILYDKVFNGHSESEKFIYKNKEYVIKYEYGKKLPKFFYGNGIGDSYKLGDMRKIIKGEDLTQKNPPKPHPYMYRS